MEMHFNPVLVTVSVLIAIFHSYVAFDLANRITVTREKRRPLLLVLGGLALGIGIWSMHFVGMFAMEMPGIRISYGLRLVLCSFAIAAGNSVLSIYLFTRPTWTPVSLFLGAAAMAVAISGMHYVAMYSMRMGATIEWNPILVVASVLIAFAASARALLLSRRLNQRYAKWVEHCTGEFDDRGVMMAGSVYMGLAIAGMHYTGMVAATFVPEGAQRPVSTIFVGGPTLSFVVVSLSVLTLGFSIALGQVDRTLARSALRLRRERELRSHFVSAIIHDLRSPLSAAKLSLHMVVKNNEQEALRKHLNRAGANLQRLEELIQTLLDAQRISSGQPLPVHVERVELCKLLQVTVENLISVHGPRFVLACTQALEGQWDATFLRRASENLCTNAAKYGARDAPIRVTATALDGEHGKRVAIQVQNHGEPLSDDERSSLFELFQRGPRAEQSGQTGWGLGLTIVKGVAEAHGGNVSVASSRSLGTVFTLELPLEQPA